MQLSECATEVSRPSEVSVELSASPVLAVTFDDWKRAMPLERTITPVILTDRRVPQAYVIQSVDLNLSDEHVFGDSQGFYDLGD